MRLIGNMQVAQQEILKQLETQLRESTREGGDAVYQAQPHKSYQTCRTAISNCCLIVLSFITFTTESK